MSRRKATRQEATTEVTAEETLSCRDCGIQAGTRDAVASTAEAYTCSRCLIAANEKAPRTADVTRNTGGQGVDSGSPEIGSPDPTRSTTSGTVLRYVATGRAFRPGRPRKSEAERRRKGRERVRVYRSRRYAERLQAADVQRAAVLDGREAGAMSTA